MAPLRRRQSCKLVDAICVSIDSSSSTQKARALNDSAIAEEQLTVGTP